MVTPGMTVNRILNDTVVMVVHCPDVDSYVLSRSPGGWTIPFAPCIQGIWRQTATYLYRRILGPYAPETMELQKTLRVWSPDNNYLFVLIFYAIVSVKSLADITSDSYERYEVINSNGIQELAKNKVLNPEALGILGIGQGCSKPPEQNLIEITKADLIAPNSPGKLDAFVNSEIAEMDQLALYSHYFDATFPYLKMDETAMTSFMSKIGLSPFTSDHFRSADITNSGCVDFREALGFIAALKGTPKEKSSTGLRSRYVFRYYDKDRDDKLTVDEFKQILSEIAIVKPKVNDRKSLMELAKQGFITHDEFANMADTFKLKGLSALLVNPTVSKAMRNARRGSSFRSSRDTGSGKLQDPSRPSYSLGAHVVSIVSPDGRTVTPPIRTMEAGTKDSSRPSLLVPSISSQETFDGASPSNSILSALNHFQRNPTEEPKWFQAMFSDFPQNLKDICQRAQTILEKEPRILKIDSPAYVIGDIHGRFEDLMNFEKYFWNYGVECCPGSILFLGDYVDRGKNSVEVVAYLFAQKIRNPNKLFLVRGNHETRRVQKEHTFHAECVSKFEAVAEEIWDIINEVFDRMPLAALIDDQIFCCHGGIPMPSQCQALEDMNKIPCPLPNPLENKLAWALLWNDPQKVGCNPVQGKTSPDGFAKNSRRKTGHTFDTNALNAFMQKHNLSYVVRAHEYQEAGFQVHQDNHLITVFSSSNYRGNNDSGCVLVQRNKLRIFTIASEEPQPTTN